MLKKTFAVILSVFLVLSVFNITALAEGEDSGPQAILSDPYFDLNSIDEGVLSSWYSSEITVNDEGLRKALQSAAKVDTLTVESMFSLPTTLNLSGLNISDLTGLEYAINVSELDISGNNVTSLEPIKNLYNLTSLNYSSNNVEVVPAWIFSARKLETVNGSYNSSVSIEAPETESSVLKNLYLENNELTALPELSALSALENLSLAGNQFESFPEQLRAMSNLRVLSLNNNKLENVGDISGLTALTSLYLNNNKIHSMPSGIKTLPVLTELQLSGNSITSVGDEITASESLESVNLSFNNITEIPESLLDAKFTKLDLGMNKINISENSDIIGKLSSKLESFYYSMQLPEFELELVHDADAPGGKLQWTPVPDVNAEDGNYHVTKTVIERKDKNTQTDTLKPSDATQPETGAEVGAGEDSSQVESAPQTDESAGENAGSESDPQQSPEDSANTNAEGQDQSSEDNGQNLPKPSVFEQVGEVEQGVCEYIDKSALSTSEYIFRVTVYIEGEYRNGVVIQTQISGTVGSDEIHTDTSGLHLWIYVGAIVIAVALMVLLILYLSKKKIKKPSKVSDEGSQRRETAQKREKKRSVDVDMSKVGTQENLEDEIDKILSSPDDESAVKPIQQHKPNPMGELFEEVKKGKKNGGKKR